MNCKKPGWTLPSSKEVAQEIIANIEECGEEKYIGEIQITQQLSSKKEINLNLKKTIKRKQR